MTQNVLSVSFCCGCCAAVFIMARKTLIWLREWLPARMATTPTMLITLCFRRRPKSWEVPTYIHHILGCMHTHMHTCLLHASMFTCLHTNLHTCACMCGVRLVAYPHIFKCVHQCTSVHTCMHTCVHTSVRTCTYI